MLRNAPRNTFSFNLSIISDGIFSVFEATDNKAASPANAVSKRGSIF